MDSLLSNGDWISHDTTALHANLTPCVEHCIVSAFMRPSSKVFESTEVELGASAQLSFCGLVVSPPRVWGSLM